MSKYFKKFTIWFYQRFLEDYEEKVTRLAEEYYLKGRQGGGE